MNTLDVSIVNRKTANTSAWNIAERARERPLNGRQQNYGRSLGPFRPIVVIHDQTTPREPVGKEVDDDLDLISSLGGSPTRKTIGVLH